MPPTISQMIIPISFPSCFAAAFEWTTGAARQTRDAHLLFRNQELLSRKTVNERQKSWVDA
jgi:hypothetical protein